MRLCLLFSGGKDSCYAGWLAREEIVCLASVFSSNPHSFMYHTPNIRLTKLQAKAMKLPLVFVESEGRKEKEISDLRKLLELAKKKYKIEGVVTGAINSIYQNTRVQRVCRRLGLWCFNPLWQIDQEEYLKKLIKAKFKVIISGVFSYPFNESWLGRKLDSETAKELISLKRKYKINPAGEGGEFETFVVDGPIFKKPIKIDKARTEFENYSGRLIIEKAHLNN